MNDDESRDNLVDSAIQAGLALSDPKSVGDTPFVVVPNGCALCDLERFLPNPTRKRAAVNALSAAGFVAYWKKHSGEAAEGCTIYADRARHRFTAIFDDDREFIAGWRDHVLTYTCPKSPEWTTWHAANESRMTQEVFAKFIEDNLPDIIEPDSATILEVSRTLEAKKSVDFASSIRLANGDNELKYTETVEGTASKGLLRIPDEFKVGIPVFLGGDTYAVTCRLRYRIPREAAKGLTMWFEMERPHKVVDHAFQLLADKLQADTGAEPIDAEVPTLRSNQR